MNWDIEIRDGDDWKQLIVNGALVYEGHSIPYFAWEGVFRSLGVEDFKVTLGSFCPYCQKFFNEGSSCEAPDCQI